MSDTSSADDAEDWMMSGAVGGVNGGDATCAGSIAVDDDDDDDDDDECEIDDDEDAAGGSRSETPVVMSECTAAMVLMNLSFSPSSDGVPRRGTTTSMAKSSSSTIRRRHNGGKTTICYSVSLLCRQSCCIVLEA